MMKNQFKLIVALAVVSATFVSSAGISEAGRPFGMFSTQSSRNSQNYSARNYSANNQSRIQSQRSSSATSYANNILHSPERMEKVYGPSILMRAEQAAAKPAVSQP